MTAKLKARRLLILAMLAAGAVTLVYLSWRGADSAQAPTADGHRQFAEAVVELLHKEMPAVQAEVREDGAISVKSISANYQSITIETMDAWLASRGVPSRREKEIRDLVKTVESALRPPSTMPADVRLARILPVIRHADFVRNVQSSYGKGYDGVHEPFAEDLSLLFVEQEPTRLAFLTDRDLAELHCDTQSVRRTAFSNLRTLAQKAKWVEVQGCFALQLDGINESSMLALDDFWRENLPPLKGDVVAIIPDSDLLVITGSESSEGLAHLRAICGRMFAKARHPISQSLYLRKDSKWSLLK